MKKIPFSFYDRDTKQVAKDLLGKILIHKHNGKTFCVRIVETEAYLGITDRACHTFGNKNTPRTRSMYLAGGHAYVYLIYGMYYCLNVVTRDEKKPEAVLIRAAEAIYGFNKAKDHKLMAGPGKLCREMKITKTEDGLALDSETLQILDDNFKIKKSHIIECPRIGVNYAQEHKDLLLRFYIKDNPCVSKKYC
ncbi:MAG: DNA-3-methyladenine glycosylase [bacterium]